MKRNVYLAQVNNRFGSSIFLPYSVGLLQAYALTIPQVRDAYDFRGFFVLRESIPEVVSQVKQPDVFGISCYIWNWEYSKALGRAVKTAYPNCLVVLGGPHVPERSEGFFRDCPWADILVHHEGEEAFVDVLRERLSPRPDYTRIRGLTVNIQGRAVKTPPGERLQDLSRIPSPYLSEVFEGLIRDDRYRTFQWDASQETHRGCPYSCTFCDWGSAVFTKVRQFDNARIIAEYEWMAQHKIGLLYNCDANYGLFARDEQLTEDLVATKAAHGYPREFRTQYAKNSNQRIFRIAQVLNQAQMCKGVTLSFQSLDPHTLRLIKRKNMAVNDFKTLITMYRDAGIPTYTELILGLPGETYEAFVNGIDTLLDAGQHDSLNIYPCMILPNAEMADPAYRQEHGIETVVIPDLLAHSIPCEDAYRETKEIVIATGAMPLEDWKRAYRFAWAIQCFHSMGLTQHLAIFARGRGITYRRFYEQLLTETGCRPLEQVKATINETIDRVLSGGPFELVLPRFGPISWTPEEATFLELVCAKDEFYAGMSEFLRREFGIGEALADDLCAYQKAATADPFSPKVQRIDLGHDLLRFFGSPHTNRGVEAVPASVEVEHFKAYAGDLETYAREIVWYGRKAVRMRPVRVTRLS